MNQNTIDIINDEIENGMRFFYFDKRSFKLVTSSPDNMGSFPQVNIYDVIELYIDRPTTLNFVVARLKFYNEII